MKPMMVKLAMLTAMTFSLLFGGIARADTFNLNYSGLNVSFVGTFTIAGDGMSGFEPILSFEGIRNGVTVSGLTSTSDIFFSNTFNNNPGLGKHFTMDGMLYGLTGAPLGTFVDIYDAPGLGYREYYSSGSLTSDSDITLTVTAAVPEPETYAMLLVGLGLIGFMSRKKKGVVSPSGVSFS